MQKRGLGRSAARLDRGFKSKCYHMEATISLYLCTYPNEILIEKFTFLRIFPRNTDVMFQGRLRSTKFDTSIALFIFSSLLPNKFWCILGPELAWVEGSNPQTFIRRLYRRYVLPATPWNFCVRNFSPETLSN